MLGTAAGAVYCALSCPVDAIVPSDEFPPTTPFTSHTTFAPAAMQNDAEKFWLCPRLTFAALGVIEFVAAHVIVTLALPDFELSALLVAVTLTAMDDGGTGGAVYVAVVAPVATMVPSVALPPEIPFTLHVTELPALPAPVTVAVNACSPPVGTFAVGGETETEIASVSVTVADPLALGLAALTAVTVIPTDGIAFGAVYVASSPLPAIVPTLKFPPAIPSTFHVTVVFVVPVTTA